MKSMLKVQNKERQFVFENFKLHGDGLLVHGGQQVRIPPKELAVLTLLLENAGQLVSKDTLLTTIWGSCEVTEDSLTRCIYGLRRILGEDKHCRYIDTVYGKGYRFSHTVVSVSERSPSAIQHLIAIFPFQTAPEVDSAGLHFSLVQALSRYLPYGLAVLPAALTQGGNSAEEIVNLIQHLRPDYYLVGRTLQHGNSRRLRVEWVKAQDHHLIHQESFRLPVEQPTVILQNLLVNLLPHIITGQNWRGFVRPALGSADMAVDFLNARRHLHRYTPSSLRQALVLLRQSANANPTYALPFCSLAECYLTMAQMGLFEVQSALSAAQEAINQAIELEPVNAQALGLLALINSIKSDSVTADVLFKQAHLLAAGSADIHYYHAWHLFLSGKLGLALVAVEKSLQLDPTRIAVGVLKLWLVWCQGNLDAAIALGNQQLFQYGQCHPVLQSVQALLLAIKGEHPRAAELIQAVREAREEHGLLTIHHLYAELSRNESDAMPDVAAFLARSELYPQTGGLLPLVLAAKGVEAARRLWQQLQGEPCISLKIWRHDPRLTEFLAEVHAGTTAIDK